MGLKKKLQPDLLIDENLWNYKVCWVYFWMKGTYIVEGQ